MPRPRKLSTTAVAAKLARPIRNVRRSPPDSVRGRKRIAVTTTKNAMAIRLFGASAE